MDPRAAKFGHHYESFNEGVMPLRHSHTRRDIAHARVALAVTAVQRDHDGRKTQGDAA
jgi:hypothetical protein